MTSPPQRESDPSLSVPTTLELITSEHGFGIKEPSPAQTAICLAIDGLSLDGLWENPDVRAVFGGERPPEVKPRSVLLVAASRALKTKMCAAAMMRSLLTCSTALLAPGDEVRLSAIGPDKDKAQAIFANMLALAQRRFAHLIVGTPLVQSFKIRREAGWEIQISLAVLAKGGTGVLSRWSAGTIFSEAPRMVGEDEGAKNINETLDALENRLLDGAQIIMEGSPWAPWGPINELDTQHFGKPTRELLVMRAPGPILWPQRYTPEYCDRLKARNPRAHQADVLGHYVDPEDSLIPTAQIDASIDKGIKARKPRVDKDGKLTHEYVFSMDPATRGNAWVVTGFTCTAENRYEQAYYRQWQGTPETPLKPSVVLREIRDDLKPYGEDSVMTDEASFDSLADMGEELGKLDIGEGKPDGGRLGLVMLNGPQDGTEADCTATGRDIRESRVRLLDVPEQRGDLQRVRKRVTSDGFTYQLIQSGDGRHCDSVPAIGKCLRYVGPPPERAANYGGPAANKPHGTSQADLVRRLTG